MKRFTDAVRGAVETQNWYAALSVALALPDICSNLLGTRGHRGYADWFDAHVRARYTRELGPQRTPHGFLNGDDCYAFRCAFLHEGKDDTTAHKAADVLDRFQFLAPRPKMTIHMNQSGRALQLQVDVFCRDICEAVDAWIAAAHTTPLVAQRLPGLLSIQ